MSETATAASQGGGRTSHQIAGGQVGQAVSPRVQVVSEERVARYYMPAITGELVLGGSR